ncbi:MAG: hypothetical protein AABY32_02195 [Nanoarchaeota archaeon]
MKNISKWEKSQLKKTEKQLKDINLSAISGNSICTSGRIMPKMIKKAEVKYETPAKQLAGNIQEYLYHTDLQKRQVRLVEGRKEKIGAEDIPVIRELSIYLQKVINGNIKPEISDVVLYSGKQFDIANGWLFNQSHGTFSPDKKGGNTTIIFDPNKLKDIYNNIVAPPAKKEVAPVATQSPAQAPANLPSQQPMPKAASNKKIK